MQWIKSALLPGLLQFFSVQLLAQFPGGIPDPSIWLQGNLSASSVRQGALNFNPAQALDGSTTPVKLPGNIGSLQRVTVFTVYQSPVSFGETSLWEMRDGSEDLSLSSRSVSSTSDKTNIVFSDQVPQGSGAFIHTYAGTKDHSAGKQNDDEASIVFGKRNAASNPGSVAPLISEFILYERILTDAEISKVETYLALKYGITLEKNYVNATGKIVWNRKKEELYSNNIAGIGRDDRTSLYQKQGTSCNNPGQLIIAVDKVSETNSKNPGQLNDKEYLVWGDNAKDFVLVPDPDNGNMLLSEKKWAMKPYNNSAGEIATDIKVNAKALLAGPFPKTNLVLIIDRSGTGDFAPQHCNYISPSEISPEGIAHFGNVYWDTDKSGKDIFAFGFRSGNSAGVASNGKDNKSNDASGKISFQVLPNPVTDGNYKVSVNLVKPGDVEIQVYDLHYRIIDSKRGTGLASYLFNGSINVPAASYIVRLKTAETEAYRILIVQ